MPAPFQIDSFATDSEAAAQRPQILDSMPLEEKIERSIALMKSYLRQGKHLVSAFSAGKDSSVATDMMLRAIRDVMAEDGHCPECAVLNSNTLIENPEMDRFSRGEIAKLRAYVDQHRLPVTVQIATPSRSNRYLLNILGGRTVASVAEMGDSKCSDVLKVTTINRAKKAIFRQYGMDSVITIIGKRYDESAHRAANMRVRQETHEHAVKNERGEWILSAIADFTLEDVYSYIGHTRSQKIASYSDFDDMMQIYRDSNDGGACELIINLSGKSSNTGCGARHGCWACARVKSDKSMENMLKQDQYAYMKPLNEFRNYLVAHHFDPSKRNWLARTVHEDGTVSIAPNAYSPDFCEDLLRYALTIDAREQEDAERLGIEHRFQILTPADVVQIEMMWSRYGYHRQFKAVEIACAVYFDGKRYPIPAIERTFTLADLPRTSVNVPFADSQFDDIQNGFRDLALMVIDQEAVVVKKDTYYSACNSDGEMTIDDEGAMLFFEFEAQRVVREYSDNAVQPTQAFHYFIRLGTVSLYKGSHHEVDRMLRMANQIHRHGIRAVLNDPDGLIEALARNMAGAEAVTRCSETIEQFELFAA